MGNRTAVSLHTVVIMFCLCGDLEPVFPLSVAKQHIPAFQRRQQKVKREHEKENENSTVLMKLCPLVVTVFVKFRRG